MVKKQGELANVSGSTLEQTVKTVFQNKGFEIVTHSKWRKHPEGYAKELLLTNVHFTTVYKHKGYTEFSAKSEKYDFEIRIECKWQQVGGSVDEKLPYLYLNTIEAMPENNIVIIIDGKGFKEGAITWLKDAVQQKKYTDLHNRNKSIEVLTISEFITWANKVLR